MEVKGFTLNTVRKCIFLTATIICIFLISCINKQTRTNDNCLTKFIIYKPQGEGLLGLNLYFRVSDTLLENDLKNGTFKYLFPYGDFMFYTIKTGGSVTKPIISYDDSSKLFLASSGTMTYGQLSKKDLDSLSKRAFKDMTLIIVDHRNKEWILNPCE